MSWRPKKGWVNPYIETRFGNDRCVSDSPEEVAYEAGADAMLEALIKQGNPIEVYMTESGVKSRIKGISVIIPDEEISDGLGSVWSAYCPVCKAKSMSVVRPGKVQCDNCG